MSVIFANSRINSLSSGLIINADDFGYSSNINEAIIHCLDNGIINSTSIMTNLSACVDAAEMAKAKGYADCVGVHVNLTEGKPLTNFRHVKYLHEDGSWNKAAITNAFLLSKEVRNDFSKEIIAQIHAAEKMGIIISHINSHHHVHTLPAFFHLFLKICHSRNYKLRIAQTHFSGSYMKLTYRRYINQVVKRYGLQFSDYFETIQSYNQRKTKIKNGITEIMVHPFFNKRGILADALNEENNGMEYREFHNRFR